MGLVENCAHNMLTNGELVQKLFAFCNKDNFTDCKESMRDSVHYFNTHCKPNRQQLRITTSSLLVQLMRDGIHVVESLYVNRQSDETQTYIKLSFKSLARQLKQALRVRRHKGGTDDILAEQIKFREGGLYFDWSESYFSASSQIHIDKVISSSRELYVQNDENRPLTINPTRNPYVYIPVRVTDLQSDDSRVDVTINLRFDDSFIDDIDRNDKALSELNKTMRQLNIAVESSTSS